MSLHLQRRSNILDTVAAQAIIIMSQLIWEDEFVNFCLVRNDVRMTRLCLLQIISVEFLHMNFPDYVATVRKLEKIC